MFRVASVVRISPEESWIAISCTPPKIAVSLYNEEKNYSPLQAELVSPRKRNDDLFLLGKNVGHIGYDSQHDRNLSDMSAFRLINPIKQANPWCNENGLFLSADCKSRIAQRLFFVLLISRQFIKLFYCFLFLYLVLNPDEIHEDGTNFFQGKQNRESPCWEASAWARQPWKGHKGLS